MSELTPPPAPPDLKRLRIERPAEDHSRAKRSPARRRPSRAWILIPAALAAAWWYRDELQRWSGLESDAPITVRTVFVRNEASTPTGSISSNGYVVARRRAALSTVLSGLLIEMRVAEGQRVEANEVIARIQYDDYAVGLETRELAMLVLQKQRIQIELEAKAAGFGVVRAEEDQRNAAQQLEQARADQRLAQIELDRQRPLLATGDVPALDLDRLVAQSERSLAAQAAAVARLAAAAAALEEARAQAESRQSELLRLDAERERARSEKDAAAILLERTYIRAPFAGVIVRKNAEEGEVVAATGGQGNSRGSVAELVDFDSLEIQVELPEARILQVSESPSAKVFFDAEPARGWPASVSRIWPTADRQKATIEVRVAFNEGEIPPLARPEMGVRVSFAPQGTEATANAAPEMLVPRNALFDFTGDRAAVFVIEENRLRRIQIELGPERGANQVVRSGLVSGSEVVIEPAPEWRAGQSIRRS